MKKIYSLLVFAVCTGLGLHAQTVEPEYFNFTQLANFERAHPEMFRKCATCGEKENDAGWRNIQDMPLPAGAIIRRQVQDNLRPTLPSNPNTPLAPSPTPAQTFLGHVDPGQGIPPDTHGAVGPNHIVTATNDFTIIQTKTGTEISRVTITAFAGVPNTCDPYIKFDPATNRWFYSAIDCSGNNGNRVAVLVSNTADPTQGWFRYSFVPNAPSGQFFLDHPYLGLDDRWVVVSGRKFPTGGFSGSLLLLLNKSTLLANSPIVFGTNAQLIEKGTADGDAPLPVTVQGTNPSPGTFYILQNWNGANGQIRLSTVTGNIPNATWNTAAPQAVFPTSPQGWTSATGNVAEQLGETRRLATNDARISTGVMVNGNIWCCHHIGVSPNNVAVQWWQLNGQPGGAFGTVLQRGRIGAGLANNYRWFPGISVNANEDVIIGYTVSSNTSRVSAAYSFRSNTTPPNTTDDEFIYRLGLSTYYKDFGGTRARWGDYSHSAVDPSDGSLWTIQEYAAQRVGPNDNDSRYGVWWAQVTPVSTLLRTDAAINSVVEPQAGLICDVPVRPRVTIRNLGTDTLRTVDVGMILDGTPLGSLNSITGLRVPTFGASAVVELSPFFNVAPGPHVLRVFTINPNGRADERRANDTTVINFTVAPALALPYTESFETLPFPPANGSAVINPDGPTGITWARFATAGNPGNASIRINLYNYQTIGQRDIYRTGRIDVSALDSLVLTFNVAHQQYFGTDVTRPSQDSLRIVISPDCGRTWLPTSYSKGGSTLSTVAGTTEANFVPTATQWRSERVVIKDFCGQNLRSVMVGFEAYNDFGNNIYVDGINIRGFNAFNLNAEVLEVSQPLPALCTNTLAPVVTIRNSGTDTLRSLNISYQIDNGPVTTTAWTGVRARCQQFTVTLPQATSTTGTHVLRVFTSDPNGAADQVPANDEVRKTFAIFEPTATPIVEGFEGLTSSSFPRAGWGVQNVNGGTTWELNQTRNAPRTGSGALLMNNPSTLNGNDALDYFISPIVRNSASFDSVFVDFDLAYRAGPQYPGATVFPLDTLEILATFDCGQTFTSVWRRFGNELQTVNDPSYSFTSAFVPAVPQEWNKVRVYLTPFVGSRNFQLYFVSKGNRQNNIWLDNININGQTLPAKLKDQGYLIYPNPFNSSFLIHHHAVTPPTDLQAAQMFNAAGQLVWDKRYNGNADRQIVVNTGALAKGVYVLKLIYNNRTVVERIVKQ